MMSINLPCGWIQIPSRSSINVVAAITIVVVATIAPRLIDLRNENISIIVAVENKAGRELRNIFK